MESRIHSLGTSAHEAEFNSIQFEKRLMQLKDSQESINSLSAWCLENRQHHKKIVTAWLNVLKKVKVEHRLTLFYLANDVIQYSKRKNYDFVESWGTTLQKATTMVREEKVKTRILRIFKIWEQRGIYGEEFIADLSGLISASPAGRKFDQDPNDFQPSYLISRIRSCTKLEADTDLKLKLFKEGKPRIMDSDTLCASLKDRQHVEDVEKEVENGVNLIEAYVNSLKAEIKSRAHVLHLLNLAEVYYSTERKEVKVVVTAYKSFTTRVKILQRKLEELIPTLVSPIPSPDVNAPSPEPDSDIDLPNLDNNVPLDTSLKCAITAGVNVYSMSESYSAGYYTPASSQNQQNFSNNNFSSFIGSNMQFDVQNYNSGNIFSETSHNSVPATGYENSTNTELDVQSHMGNMVPQTSHVPEPSVDYAPVYTQPLEPQPVIQQQPLLPPPMPPFTSSCYDNPPYTDTSYGPPPVDSYATNLSYEEVGSAPYMVSSEVQAPYPPQTDAYNPEEEVETWEPETTWDVPPDLETPESPPMFEKEGFAEPVEYDDSKATLPGLGKDVDHRVLLPPPQMPSQLSDHIMSRQTSKDVDHRNLISLTGSPGRDNMSTMLQPPPAPPDLWSGHTDQDYRGNGGVHDQDYRMPVDIAQQLKLPPPPPPPTKCVTNKKVGNHDNVESIDMELSDDESVPAPIQMDTEIEAGGGGRKARMSSATKKIPTLISAAAAASEMNSLQPPPPVPQNLCGDMPEAAEPASLAGKQANGLDQVGDGLLGPGPGSMGPAPIPQLCEVPPGAGWPSHGPDDWFDMRQMPGPGPDFQERPFGAFPGRHKHEFRGGYRGRGRGAGPPPDHLDHAFRPGPPRPRGRLMRTRPMRAFHGRPPRSFRPPFRGAF